MIALILCAIALLYIAPFSELTKREKELRESWAKQLQSAYTHALLEIEIEGSEATGQHIVINTNVLDEEQRDVFALRVMSSSANVDLIHEGKHIPTLKQVMEKLLSEPRPSP
ncbi:hypothetical protein QZK48_08115 [Acinetobacter baumannii]|nr:hypothetical protein [Acinetobacter baumannii]